MRQTGIGRSWFLVSGVLLVLAGLTTIEVRADVVHLKNGRRMEGVVLEESPEQVLLKLPFGEIGLPRASIESVERERSALAEYLDRRLELEQRHGTASDWLELALWVKAEGLGHSAREATLVAARLDPGLPGLIPLMTEMGYQYEANQALWMPHDEIMRRRGYVLSQGRWLSPGQIVEQEQAQVAAVAMELERQRRERLTRAMEMMVLAQMAQAEETRRLRQEAAVMSYGLPLWGGYPVIVPPVHPPRRPEHHRYGSGHRTGRVEAATRRSSRKARVRGPVKRPGPVKPATSHRGGFQPPPK